MSCMGRYTPTPVQTLDRASDLPPKGARNTLLQFCLFSRGFVLIFRVIWFDFQVVGKVFGKCFGALWWDY